MNRMKKKEEMIIGELVHSMHYQRLAGLVNFSILFHSFGGRLNWNLIVSL